MKFIILFILCIFISIWVLQAQTLTSQKQGNDIVFSPLNDTSASQASDVTSSFSDVSASSISGFGEATPAVQYGPWGCKLTVSPWNFNCGKDKIPPPPPNVSREQEIILDFLKTKKAELEQREKDISLKEGVVADLEKRVEQKINEAQALNNKISEQRQAEASSDSANLTKLVGYYEKIPAENAAVVLSSMDQQTAAMILTRMNARKVAAIFAELDPAKAANLTEGIAKIKTNRDKYLTLPDYNKK